SLDAKQRRTLGHAEEPGVLLGCADRGDRLGGAAELDAELLGEGTALERLGRQSGGEMGSGPARRRCAGGARPAERSAGAQTVAVANGCPSMRSMRVTSSTDLVVSTSVSAGGVA